MTNSDILRSLPSAAGPGSGEGARLGSAGVGGPVLAATLSKLAELPVRTSFCTATVGGAGCSRGAMETRPAMRETRCCDERRVGRGDVGERAGNGGLLLAK